MSKERQLRIFISHPSHFLTDSAPHGDGLLAFEYIKRLAERGHQLHVAVPLMKLAAPLPPGITLYPVRSWTRSSTDNPSPQNRIEYAIRVRSLLRQIKRRVPLDMIHQLNPVVAGMGLLLADAGLPIVLGPLPPHIPARWDAVANKDEASPQNARERLRQMALQRQLRDASLVLIPTAKSLDRLPDNPAIRKTVRMLNYGIDTEVFRPAHAASSTPPSILFLSNLARRKGAFLLLEAFQQIAAQFPGTVLRFAGDGTDGAELRRRAAQNGASAQIDFVGHVPRSQIPAVLNGCGIFCLPSYCEPFGMAALEAMSCGKPVVGTNSGGLGLLLDEAGARRVDPGNATQLAFALAELLRSPALRESMGHHNRLRAIREFAWDVVIQQLENLYYEMLGEAPLCAHPREALPTGSRSHRRQEAAAQ